MNSKDCLQPPRQWVRRLLLIVLPAVVLVAAAIILFLKFLYQPDPFPGLAFPSEEAFVNALKLDCSGMYPSSVYTEEQADDYLQTRDIRYPFAYYHPASAFMETNESLELAYIEVNDDSVLYAYAHNYDTLRDPYLQEAGPEHRILLYWMRDTEYGNEYLHSSADGTYTLQRLRFFIPNEQQDDRRILWRETQDSWFVGRFPESMSLDLALDLCEMSDRDAPAPHDLGNGGIVLLKGLVSWEDYANGPIHRAQVELPVAGNQQPMNIIVDDDLNIWYDDGYTHISRYNLNSGTTETEWTADEDARVSVVYADLSYIVWTENRTLTANNENKYQLVVLDRKSGAIQYTPLPANTTGLIDLCRCGDSLYFHFDAAAGEATDYTNTLMAYNLVSQELGQLAEGQFSLHSHGDDIYWRSSADLSADWYWYTIRADQVVALSDQELAASDLPYFNIAAYAREQGSGGYALTMHQGGHEDLLAHLDRSVRAIDFCSGWSIRQDIYAPALVVKSKDIPLVPLFYDMVQRTFVELDSEPLAGFSENWIPGEYSSGQSWYQTVQTEEHLFFYAQYRSREAPYKLELIWIDREDLP